MLSLTPLSEEVLFGHFDPLRHRGYNLRIDFPDGSLLDFDFAVPKKHNKENAVFEWERAFTIDIREFETAHLKGADAAFGRIWHDYCADSPIRTKDGKIGIYLVDFSKKPTLLLSADLTQQLLGELKRHF